MRVVIIGSGNVAEALAYGIHNSAEELVQIYARNSGRVVQICECVGLDQSVGATIGEDELAQADVYIISVSDSSVASVSQGIKFPEGAIVAHTAASIGMDSIYTQTGIKKAVLYPLQTFTKGRRIDFRSVPIFIEAQDEPTYLKIESLALTLSDRVVPLSSARRRELHLAAVYTCNFTMAMLTATHDILERCGLPLDLYEPLMQETINKAFTTKNDPRYTLTGPAVRGDEQTMAKHIELIKSEPELKESGLLIDIYNIISKYIWETSKRI